MSITNEQLQGGTVANDEGMKGEEVFNDLVRRLGGRVVEFEKEKEYPGKDVGELVAVYQHPITPCWGFNSKCDYMLFRNGRSVRVEIKNQKRGGSVDEKVTHAIIKAEFGLKKGEDFSEFWLILLGDHWSDGGFSRVKFFRDLCEELTARWRTRSAKFVVLVGAEEVEEKLEILLGEKR